MAAAVKVQQLQEQQEQQEQQAQQKKKMTTTMTTMARPLTDVMSLNSEDDVSGRSSRSNSADVLESRRGQDVHSSQTWLPKITSSPSDSRTHFSTMTLEQITNNQTTSTDLSHQRQLTISQQTTSADYQINRSTNHQCQFLPDEILLALTQPPVPPISASASNQRRRNKKNESTTAGGGGCAGEGGGMGKKPPANLWNYPSQREKLKHLVNNPPCICGAGQDISFLYDAQKPVSRTAGGELPRLAPPGRESREKETVTRESTMIGGGAEMRSRSSTAPTGLTRQPDPLLQSSLVQPDSVPLDEYCVFKNKGIVGFDFAEDNFTIVAKDHEKHQTIFPSMNPTSRYEVLLLKQTLKDMLYKAGIITVGVREGNGGEEEEEDGKEEEEEEDAPSQLHRLVELIRKEQDIYNVIFHELIRQVSIECVERGQLLSEVRSLYSNLLSRIPRQIHSLHDEVLAQRALDRRLTEELFRFQARVSLLNSDLHNVQSRDIDVVQQVRLSRKELFASLADATRNANQAAEYHAIYELQRSRLQHQVEMLRDESQLWCGMCYSLTEKLIAEHCLNSCKDLSIAEKSWGSLAGHFTTMLTDRDTKNLQLLRSHVEKWRDLLEEFDRVHLSKVSEIKNQLRLVMGEIKNHQRLFSNSDQSRDKILHGSDRVNERLVSISSTLKRWERVIMKAEETFGGDSVLDSQNSLKKLDLQVSAVINCALDIFNRHSTGNEIHPCHSQMIHAFGAVESVMKTYPSKISGEDGCVAESLSKVIKSLDDWQIRLGSVLRDSAGGTSFPEAIWTEVTDQLNRWTGTLEVVVNFLDIETLDDNDNRLQSVPVLGVIERVRTWLETSTLAIDSEDAKLSDLALETQKEMMLWLTQILLLLVPVRQDQSPEARHRNQSRALSQTTLTEQANELASRIATYTARVTKCCAKFIADELLRKRDVHDEDADKEQEELMRFEMERVNWIDASRLILKQLDRVDSCHGGTNHSEADEKRSASEKFDDAGSPEDVDRRTSNSVIGDLDRLICKEEEIVDESEVMEDKISKHSVVKDDCFLTDHLSASAAAKNVHDRENSKDVETIEILGYDHSTRTVKLKSPSYPVVSEQSKSPPLSSYPCPQDVCNVLSATDGSGFSALMSMQILQRRLLEAERRAQLAEERALSLEERLSAAETELRSRESGIALISSSTSSEAQQPQMASAVMGRRRSPATKGVGKGGGGGGGLRAPAVENTRPHSSSRKDEYRSAGSSSGTRRKNVQEKK